VAERDAFGREIEDAAPSIPTAEPTGDDGGGGGGASNAARAIVSAVVVLLIVAGITTAVIVGIGGKDDDSGSGLSVGTNVGLTTTAEAPRTQTETTAPPPAPRSLIRPAAFSDALAKLRGRGRLRLLRVAADRIDAQLVTRSGGLRNVQVTADGAVHDFGTGGGAGGLTTVPYTQVDTRAPARMVAAAARRSGRKASRVDYLVLLALSGGPSWNLYFKPDGLHFAGDRHGNNLRRL
jgi:hypothetical protein